MDLIDKTAPKIDVAHKTRLHPSGSLDLWMQAGRCAYIF
jgi:hypothetical protein